MKRSSPHSLPEAVQLEEGLETAVPADEKPRLSPWHEALFVTVLCCTQLITQAAFGAVLVPLHVLGSELGSRSAGDLGWFCASYSLTVGTFVLVAGRLGDIYGHKLLLISGWAWFGLWSFVAGFSAYPASPIFFIICRALQGIGPAVMLPNSLAIIGRSYGPGRRKDMIFALFASTAPIGFVLGALIGAVFAEYVWWPWILWSNTIVCLVLAVIGHLSIPVESPTESDQRFDTLGAILGVIGLVLINIAWNQAPTVGWSKPYIIIVLLLGLFCLVSFALHSRKCAHPLIPLDVIDSSALCIIACVALGWSSFGIWIFYTFQLLEVLRNISPLMAAVQFISQTIMGISAAVATGFLLSRVKSSWLLVGALFAFTAGCVLSATAPVRQIYWANVFVSMMVIAWG